MRILINSSPRKKGNCAYLADRIAEKYSSEIERINLWDLKYRGCMSCRACRINNTFCTQKDDLEPFWEKLSKASQLIILSPNYIGGVNGELKQMVDRFYGMRTAEKTSRFKQGAKLFFILTQGSANRDRSSRILEWFKGIAENHLMKYYGFVVPACSYDNTDGAKVKTDELLMNLSFF